MEAVLIAKTERLPDNSINMNKPFNIGVPIIVETSNKNIDYNITTSEPLHYMNTNVTNKNGFLSEGIQLPTRH